MLIERMLARFYQDQESGDGSAGGGAGGSSGSDGGGAGGGSGDAGAGSSSGGDVGSARQGAGAGDGGNADAGASAAGKGGSLLETLGKGTQAQDGQGQDDKNLTPEQKALQAAEKDTRRPKHVPAKFWNAESGEVNFEAWAKSTITLETRMKDLGLPPETADGYKFEVPKELKEAGFDLDPKMAKSFRDQALAMGLTQKQYEGVMGQYLTHMQGIANQASTFSADNARTELLAYYKTEQALNENVKHAFRAFSAFADEKDMELIDTIGNIPAVIRVMAKVGKEMAEDPGVSPDALLDSESLDQLMRGGPGKEDSPYWNAEDPRHKATVAKVMRHHEAQANAARRKAA